MTQRSHVTTHSRGRTRTVPRQATCRREGYAIEGLMYGFIIPETVRLQATFQRGGMKQGMIHTRMRGGTPPLPSQVAGPSRCIPGTTHAHRGRCCVLHRCVATLPLRPVPYL